LKLSTIGLGALAIAATAATSGCAVILGLYAPGAGALNVFLNMPPVLKVCVVLVSLTTVGVALAGLVGLRLARRDEAGTQAIQVLLVLSAAACILLGVLGALYGEMNTQMAIKAVGPVRFAVTAPSRAEALLALAIGLWGATFAIAFLLGIANRVTAPVSPLQ